MTLIDGPSAIVVGDPPGEPLADSRLFRIVILLVQVINIITTLSFGPGIGPLEGKIPTHGATRTIVQGEILVPIADHALREAYKLKLLIFRVAFLLLIIFPSISFLAVSIPRVLLTFDISAKVSTTILSSNQSDQGAGAPLSGVGACVLTPATVNLFYNMFLPRVDQCEASSLFASLYGSL